MSECGYRPAEYARQADKRRLLELYREVFHVDFAYDEWYCEQRSPLGVVAVDEGSGEIIGHFGTLRFASEISKKPVPFRMSMGFMVLPEYRGKGIALQLYRSLRQEVLKRKDAAFIIGFPNDVSFKMHVGQMDYTLLRNYHFVRLPNGTHQHGYQLEESFFREEAQTEANRLEHSKEYMLWRYANKKYDKWRADHGRVFISTRFMDKADILYWSCGASKEELLDFAAFLYSTQGVKKVTTWNTAPFLDAFPGEERNYHMCLNYLDCGPALRRDIQRNWIFYMGDCELF